MSTAQQDNIYWLPPQKEQRRRLALLLQVRRVVRRAAEAARHVPRAAAAFIARMTQGRLLAAPARLLSVFRARAMTLAAPLIERASRHPWAAALGLLLTSTHGRTFGTRLLRVALKGLRQVQSTAIRLTTAGLLRLGVPGRMVVETVQAWTQRIGAVLRQRLAPLAFVATVVWKTSKALRAALVRLLRSYLTHKALSRLVRSRVRLAFLEAVLLPAVANSRLVAWINTILRRTQNWEHDVPRDARTHPATASPAAPPAPPAAPKAPAGVDDNPALVPQRPTPTAPSILDEDEDVDVHEHEHAVVDGDGDGAITPLPGNRAERRAMERLQARQQRRPKAS